jgi:PIN domain nuclease of toxin-antitoxin system
MAVLWMGFSPAQLSKRASEILCDANVELRYSMVSLWEIGLKMGGGGYREFRLPDDWESKIPARLERQGITRVEITPKDFRLIQDLPFHHKDPFDRMIIAQTLHAGFTVISSDKCFDDYGVKRLW